MTFKIFVAVSAVSLLGAASTQCSEQEHGDIPSSPIDGALDGDTVIINGEAYNVAGIDAPELGPWAKCWAEAALAGDAKHFVESTLSQPGWRIAGLGKNKQGIRTVQFAHKEGTYPGHPGDLADEMIVAGFAADTDGRWDWCGSGAKLEMLKDGTPRPHGPNLWWPAGRAYDPRAAQ